MFLTDNQKNLLIKLQESDGVQFKLDDYGRKITPELDTLTLNQASAMIENLIKSAPPLPIPMVTDKQMQLIKKLSTAKEMLLMENKWGAISTWTLKRASTTISKLIERSKRERVDIRDYYQSLAVENGQQ